MAQETPATQNGCETVAAPPKAVSFSSFKPQLVLEASKASEAVEFYKTAFGAEEIGRTTHPKRKAEQDLPLLLSAEIKLGSAVFSVSDLVEGSVAQPSTGCVFVLETEDVQTAVSNAVTAGAVAEGEITEDEGGMVGKVKDPYGFVWVISSTAKKMKSSDAATEA